MKKISKIAFSIITLLSTFILMENVYAACKEGETNCRDTKIGTIYANNSSSNATKINKSTNIVSLEGYDIVYRKYIGNGVAGEDNDANNYNILSSGAKFYTHGHNSGADNSGLGNFVLYCLDANAAGMTTNYAKRFLLDSSNSKSVNAYDAAIMYVLVNGQKNDKNSDDYFATSIAIRALTATWNFTLDGSSNSTKVIDLQKTYSGQAYRWINNYVKDTYNILKNNGVNLNSLEELSNYKNYDFTVKWNNGVASQRGEIIINRAMDLYNNALKAAAKYVTNTNVATVKADPSPVILSNGEKEYTIHLNNFTNDGKASFRLTDVDTSIIKSVTIASGNRTYSVVPTSANLLAGITISDDMTIKIVVNFNGYTQCGKNLNYKYNDSSISDNMYSNYVGIVWYSTKTSGEKTANQRFFSLAELSNGNNNNDGTPGTLQLTLPCDCEDLYKDCMSEYKSTNNYNGQACTTLKNSNCTCSYLQFLCDIGITSECNRRDAICGAKCNPVVSKYDCCDENNNLKISENDDKEVDILGIDPNEIKSCFVEKINTQKDNSTANLKSYDQDGYTYADGTHDEKNNSYTLKNGNKYCVVSCKEDYLMTMPNAKRANSGRYFTFNARVEGVKSCYTNQIDIDQYNTDIKNLFEDMSIAYTQYNKYKTLDNNGQGVYMSKKYAKFIDMCGIIGCKKDSDGHKGVNNNLGYDSYTFNYKYQDGLLTYDITKTSNLYNFENENNIGTVNDIAGFTIYRNGEVTYSYNGSFNKMHDGGESGGGGCGRGATCSEGNAGSYSNISKSIQAYMEYWWKIYSDLLDKLESLQKQYRECSDNSWGSAIKYDPDVYYNYGEEYLTKFHKERDNMDSSIVSSSTDNLCYYNNVSDSDLANENCTGTTKLPVSTNIYYVTCDRNNCVRKLQENMPTTSYVRKTSTITTDYKPATLFYNIYPSGEITTKENAPATATPVTNGLPISLKTSRGIYEYSVNISRQLGEVDYKSGTMGRYVGSQSAVIDYKNLKYSCAYLVNMGQNVSTGDISCEWNKCNNGECTANCVGPNCENRCKKGPCTADCIGLGCIYDTLVGSSVVEKSISLSNVFPSDTTSLNWSTEKGKQTKKDIEQAGNTIYAGTPILSVTINRNNVQAIKDYNKQVLQDGGYSNSTISCSDINGAKIACYSSFINDLVNGENQFRNVNILNGKPNPNRDDPNNYFTTWTGNKDRFTGPAWY